MNTLNPLRKALWANVVYLELGALAALFLENKSTAIDDLTNGQGLVFGLELLAFAGLVTYAAWKPNVARGLAWLIIALNSGLAIYLLLRLTDASISSISMELIAVDALVLLTLIAVQVRCLRAQTANAMLTS